MDELATVGQVTGAAVRFAQVVGDRVCELLGERFVTGHARMSGGQRSPRLIGQEKHLVDWSIENLSDLGAGQSRVAVQDDGNPLVVGERPKVGDDGLGGGRRRGAVNQLNALSGFPGQPDGSTSGLHHGPECLDARMLHPGQPPIELREDHLDKPLGSDRITREEVGRGLNERTLPLDHSGVLLVAGRRHASPLVCAARAIKEDTRSAFLDGNSWPPAGSMCRNAN